MAWCKSRSRIETPSCWDYLDRSYVERHMDDASHHPRGGFSVFTKMFQKIKVENQKIKNEKILAGIAGEYFVAGELSRMGIVAGLTLRNNADIDIVATSNNGAKSANIQVKTYRKEKAKGWDMGSKKLGEKDEWNNTFYVFVTLSSEPKNKNIDYYVIPKNLLNKKVENKFQEWKKDKNKITGEERKSERRRFNLWELPEFEDYKDSWHITGLLK